MDNAAFWHTNTWTGLYKKESPKNIKKVKSNILDKNSS